MAVVQGRAIGPRSTDGGVGGMAAAPPAVGCIHEHTLCSILHHVGLDLLHDLHVNASILTSSMSLGHSGLQWAIRKFDMMKRMLHEINLHCPVRRAVGQMRDKASSERTISG